ncbi:MAG: response regulator transcription factor [Candidatus Acidiferrales bacterium]
MATQILIADDHEMMRTALRNLINSHAGWQVCAEAKNGSEAVAQAKELHPDLIVLDLAMPVMDGMTAAREITRNRPGTRVIMFTLHASPEVEEHAKRAGVKRVVSKAQNGGRLMMAMEQVLVGSESQESNSTKTAPVAEFAKDLRARTAEAKDQSEEAQRQHCSQTEIIDEAVSPARPSVQANASEQSSSTETSPSEIDSSNEDS